MSYGGASMDFSDPRGYIITINHELMRVTPAVSESDTTIPSGFKEKK
jgi:hypothetical protein